MSRTRPVRRAAALFAVSLLAAPPLFAQNSADDRPAILRVSAPSKAERNHAEAASLYGLGSIHESKHRLLEALRCYEEACKLDPDAAAPRRALVPIYLAIDRVDDALAAARRVLELDRDDWETGALCARQLRLQGKPKEATEVLRRAAVSPRLKEKPDALAQLWLDLAGLEEEIGDWQRAAAALTKLGDLLDHPAPLIEEEVLTAEEAASRAAETYESLGRVWLKAGDPVKAVAAFETARSRDPGRSGRLALHLAEIHDKAGRPREALARLDEYLTSRPSGTEGYEMKIRLLKTLGEADRIVPALDEASRADSHNRALSLLLARELRRAGRTQAAEKLYGKLIADSPAPDAYRGLFDLYKERGLDGGKKALHVLDGTVRGANPENSNRNDQADVDAAKGRAMLVALRENTGLIKLILDAARRELEKYAGPNEPANHAALHPITCKLLGMLAERTRQLEAAEELYRSCLDAGATPLADEHAIYQGLLEVLLLEHKYGDVIVVSKQGLKHAQGTNRVVFFDNLRAAHLALGQFKEALEAADAAETTADPDNRLYCQGQRIRTLTAAGKHDEAIAACQALLREYNQPQQANDQRLLDKQAAKVRGIRLELSQAYGAAHLPEKSDEQLRLLLEANPDDVTANNNLGFQWAERGVNLAEAERMIRKAIELDRRDRGAAKPVGLDSDHESAAYIDSLGWVLFRKGDLKGARAELEKATSLPDGEEDPVVWDHLADVLFRLGEKDKAVATWRKALALFDSGTRPKDERYQEIQQKLRQTAP
jgi:tetratricopeptide (TPR) repeat protein